MKAKISGASELALAPWSCFKRKGLVMESIFSDRGLGEKCGTKMKCWWFEKGSTTWHFNRATFYNEAGGCLDKTVGHHSCKILLLSPSRCNTEAGVMEVRGDIHSDSSQLEPGHFQSAGRKFGFVVVKHFGTCFFKDKCSSLIIVPSSSSLFPHTCHESLWTKSRDVRHYCTFKKHLYFAFQVLCYDSTCMSHVEDVI